MASELISSPQKWMDMAVEQGAQVDVIERLAKLYREEREYQATVDFDEALNRCQRRMKHVSRDMTRTDGRGKYATYEALDNEIRPIYTSEGFAISYDEGEKTTAEFVEMIGKVSRSGQTRLFRKYLPIDAKGPKGNDVMTKTDASCSASSRAKRYVLKAVFNLSEGEDDTDGKETIVLSDSVKAACAVIEDQSDLTSLNTAYLQRYRKAFDANDSVACNAFMASYTRRKGELERELSEHRAAQ